MEQVRCDLLNELRLVRARVQLGDSDDSIRWYESVLSTDSRDRELYLDWIDIGYVECLVARKQFGSALERYDEFFERWSQRPNVDLQPYIDARELLVSLVRSSG